jgi:Homeodomain-like domain
MPGRSKLTADAAEQAALGGLSKSEHRGEADRARAILLTLAGQRAETIAVALGVHVSTVHNWRGYFAQGGVAGLRRHGAGTAGHNRPACRGDGGCDPERGCTPRRRLDAGAPRSRDRPARRAGDLAALAVAPTAPKGFVFRRPRHTLKGRQDKAAAASRERLAHLKPRPWRARSIWCFSTNRKR